jgi:metal-responsive CopG/Arc/MetJ family transcriptional regulator
VGAAGSTVHFVKGYQVNLYMPDELVEALDAEAIRRDISRAALIREACEEKLASQSKRRPSKQSRRA